jgi:hypothetical protein
MLELVFNFFSTYLIEFMSGMLAIGLILRYAAYKSSVKNYTYFSTFTGEIEKALVEHQGFKNKAEDTDGYLEKLLNEVKDKLPKRSVRQSGGEQHTAKAKQLGANQVVSLRDYVSGEGSLFHSVRGEAVSFKSPFPPNYPEIADRILEKDDNYNKLFGFIPVAPVARLINVLPGLFVVFGIFGTFIGISMALPEIAKMDFNNLDSAGEILTSFVLSVTYAMKTSIAGILYSLIMTVLNTVAPVKALRDKTDKQFSSCLENIWMAIHEKGNEEEQTVQLLKEIHSTLSEIQAKQGAKKKSA